MKNRLLHQFHKRRNEYASNSSSIIALLLTALGVLVTTGFTTATVNQHSRDMQASRRQQSMRYANHITDTTADYEQLLLAASGAMKVYGDKQAITKIQWQRLTTNLQVQTRHPEILGFGYAAFLTQSQLAGFVANMRAEGFTNYDISPDTPRQEYTAVQYQEPFDASNTQAFGYDMYTDNDRRAAMSLARDSAATAITSPVSLRQDIASSVASPAKGIVMYYPIYTSDTVPDTIQARRASLRGYVYIGFRVPDMMQLADVPLANGKYSLTDVSDPDVVEMYSISDGDSSGAEQQDSFAQDMTVLNRKWRSTLYLKDPYVNRLVNPVLTFSLGILTSCLLGVGLYVLLSRRMRLVHSSHQQELQRTKDELLALTSHQLRTPATGVKQYLGMLVNGYFGDLEAEQAVVAHKAYAANERQLEIIDQLLYVAKADAGQILLVTERVDLALLVREVLDGFHSATNAKSVKLAAKIPTKIYCRGDPRYIRMIVENLVSNAIKYSYNNTTIRITLASRGATITLSVKDNGVGIADADISKLFQKFGRIENPLSRTEGGSGLGLFLAQKLARAHHGSIHVRSGLGSGSTFTLVLPKAQPRIKNVAQLTDA